MFNATDTEATATPSSSRIVAALTANGRFIFLSSPHNAAHHARAFRTSHAIKTIVAIVSLGECVSGFIKIFVRQLTVTILEEVLDSRHLALNYSLRVLRFFREMRLCHPTFGETPTQKQCNV